ncbi:MAG: DUF309 domain-containing protein [Planctomycetota bacterium]
MRTCALLSEGEPAALIEAARAGAEEAGGRLRSWDEVDPLDADAFLVAAPAKLFALPGTLKARLDAWLELLPQGRLIPRTADKPAGYLCSYTPDDDAIGAAVETQLRGMFGFLGMVFRGCASGYVPAGGAPSAELCAVARRLGAVLVSNAGFAGFPSEYMRGVELFNEEEFWEAHEVWEDLWVREETEIKLYYQGLIQVASGFHHFGHGNWSGMDQLMREGVAKLVPYRPFAQGLDLDGFLDDLGPWLDLAAARTGNAPPVTRIPDSPPRISLQG